jgi:KaiC/GvpD/RAD55 family RecA-like ATPase
MRLKRVFYPGSSVTYTVEEAVDYQLTDQSQAGKLEDLVADVRHMRTYMAALTQALVDNGALTELDVLKLLPGFEPGYTPPPGG